mmetsp:Transcript_107220/g.284298  ORF Transcript_107220/g.284298 Transcript_107220/m.284298 type:complete len:262 (+) Transcript_107220:1083-1868(+)
MEAYPRGPIALPIMCSEVHDDAIQGRKLRLEGRGHGDKAVPRGHCHRTGPVRRRCVADVETRLAGADDEDALAPEDLGVLVRRAVEDLPLEALLAREHRNAWNVVKAGAHRHGIPSLLADGRLAGALQNDSVAAVSFALDVQDGRAHAHQPPQLEVRLVLFQVGDVVLQGHVNLGVGFPEVREERQELARHHAGVLVGFVLEGAADFLGVAHDVDLMPALAQRLRGHEARSAGSDDQDAHGSATLGLKVCEGGSIGHNEGA